jgi:hypothetical protein
MNPWLAAGGTAVVMSDRARTALRRGVVLGLAGAITAGETVLSTVKGVAESAENAASAAGDLASDLVGEAQKMRTGTDGGRKASGAKSQRGRQRGAAPARRRAPAASRTAAARPAAGASRSSPEEEKS